MTVVLHSNAEHLEAVHSDGRGFYPLLALQHHVDRPSKESNKCVSLARGEEDLGQLELQDLAHNLQGSLELCGRIPSCLLVLGRTLFGLSTSSGSRHRRGFFSRLCLDSSNSPLQEKGVYLEELLVVGHRVLLIGGVDVAVNRVGLGTQAAHDEVEDLAEGVGGEVCCVSGSFN